MQPGILHYLSQQVRCFVFGVVAIVLFGLLSSPEALAEAIFYHGYSLASPVDSMPPSTELKFPLIRNETKYDVIVSVSKKGETQSLEFDQELNSQIEEYIRSILSDIMYRPATFDGKKKPSQLPLIVFVNPRFRNFEILFPVSYDFRVNNNAQYHEALRLNDFELPEIISFPKYYCDVKMLDSPKVLPYVLEKISLDSTGSLLAVENVSASLEAYSIQMESASLWAKFAPLKIEGVANQTDCYLLVSFLPQLSYPTEILTGNQSDSSHWTKSWRVMILPDTIGIMVPPIPKYLNIETLPLIEPRQRSFIGEVSASIIIDSLGKANVIGIDRKDIKYHRAINSALKGNRFYPAMDFQGNPLKSVGKARFYFNSSADVRVDYLWLEF